jgi:high-affinity iron transporter
MLASFVLAMREGLEAALIIGILLGGLQKLDYPQGRRMVWLGVGGAVLLSLLAGILLNVLGANFSGRSEMIFEGVTMLMAAGILTWVILWIGKQAQEMNQKLKRDVQQAVLKENAWALLAVAFLAVIREGVELAIFLTAAAVTTNGRLVLMGAGLGLLTSAAIAVLIFTSLIQLNLTRFFQVSSIILILFAAGLVAHGVHEFNEAGLIPPIVDHVWDINHILDENSTLGHLLKTLVGYNGNPSLTEVISYLSYFGILGLLWGNLLNKDASKKVKEVAA